MTRAAGLRSAVVVSTTAQIFGPCGDHSNDHVQFHHEVTAMRPAGHAPAQVWHGCGVDLSGVIRLGQLDRMMTAVALR